MKTKITCLNDLIDSDYFSAFESDKLGNQLFIDDPERADRIHQAAENGCDGSTHAEHIEDWREANQLAARGLYCAQFMNDGYPKFLADNLAEQLRDYIADEIDETEAWHEKNGSLQNQVA